MLAGIAIYGGVGIRPRYTVLSEPLFMHLLENAIQSICVGVEDFNTLKPERMLFFCEKHSRRYFVTL